MLDDFTTGFWTRYADTAGGCEEVVAVGGGIGTGAVTGKEVIAVGSGIGTRAVTGVELNKKGGADRAAENIGWADRAA
jgi:hypothetical protein